MPCTKTCHRRHDGLEKFDAKRLWDMPVTQNPSVRPESKCCRVKMKLNIRSVVTIHGQLTAQKPFVRGIAMNNVYVRVCLKPHSIGWLSLSCHQLGFGSVQYKADLSQIQNQ